MPRLVTPLTYIINFYFPDFQDTKNPTSDEGRAFIEGEAGLLAGAHSHVVAIAPAKAACAHIRVARIVALRGTAGAYAGRVLRGVGVAGLSAECGHRLHPFVEVRGGGLRELCREH
ncbi:hypothetical protein AAFH49_10495 [Hymenobacter segetis]|uniref:Uncharacterized protein n=1 Tax=Hymenobacter segetis TaxID=2025509 RepID=A0ABU9LV95_9BACT